MKVRNKEERERIGANSRRLVEEEYNLDKIGEKLEGLYRDILEDRMLKGGIKWF